jgi:hypothetical protein
MKSSRHSKITGDFGEHLVLYYLSRYGFECARVDHTGIDILARTQNEHDPRGISVKTASRIETRAHKPSRIEFSDLEKAETACRAFNAIPYLAVVFDSIQKVFILLESTASLRQRFSGSKQMSFHFDEKTISTYRKPTYAGMFIECSVDLKGWNKRG